MTAARHARLGLVGLSAFATALIVALGVGVSGCVSDPSNLAPDGDMEEWVSLLDENLLDSWIPKVRGYPAGEDPLETFRMEDGVLKVSYENYGDAFEDRFGHLFYELPYGYYRLKVLYRFVGEQLPDGPGWAFRNSGLMLHSQDPGGMGIDQDFPISIEVQLLGGDGTNERPTANLCTPGTHVEIDGVLETRHCINAESPTFHGDDWVEVEVVVLGDSLIAHAVEGQPVIGYSRPQVGGGSVDGHDPALKVDGQPLTAGYISVQSESHPVEFSRIDILNLSGCRDSRAVNFRSYLEHDEPGSCRYE